MNDEGNIVTSASLEFLKHCYKYSQHEWPHCTKEALPDCGFEMRFREYSVRELPHWVISAEREMRFSFDIDTASGTSHEIDLVANDDKVIAAVELKNRPGFAPEKNDVIVFFAKLMDYLANNSFLTLHEICPVLVSATTFEQSGLAACLGLGIHPVAPSLRPVPVLLDTASRIENDIKRHTLADVADHNRFLDFRAELSSICTTLQNNWFSNRFGYLSADSIVVKSTAYVSSLHLSEDLRRLNAECSALLNIYRLHKMRLK